MMPRRDDPVDEEIRSHLEMAVRDRMERGEARAQAEAAARREFGNVVTIKEVTRDMHPYRWLAQFGQDLRYAARLLARSPAFAIASTLSLALGIGATTALFQLIDAVQLRSLPVSRPHELARIRIANMDGARGNFSQVFPSLTNPVFEELRRQQQGFSEVAAWSRTSFNLADGGEIRLARGVMVSGGYFGMLGLSPAAGRLLAHPDDTAGCPPRAVLSYDFWQREFGGDPRAVGRSLTLNAQPSEIVGVAPAGFFGLDVGTGFDVAVQICAERTLNGAERLTSGSDWWLVAVGRLAPEWTPERATAHLRAISPGIFESTLSPTYPIASAPKYRAFTLVAVSAAHGDSQLRGRYQSPLWTLLSIAAVVLVIACANLANLLLARASARRREIAVRLGLGASRGRIVRQLLTESALLAAIGAVGGVLIAGVLSRGLVSFLAPDDAVALRLDFDWRILGFAAGLGCLTCVLAGLTPALRATKGGIASDLRPATRGGVGVERSWLRQGLVAAQVALSFVLIAAGLLFARSLGNLRDVETGFRRNGILVAGVDMRRLDIPLERRLERHAEALDRIRALPRVRSAAAVSVVPVSGSSSGNKISIEGTDTQSNARINRVGPGYFQTMGIPMIAGRDFTDRDAPGATNAAIVDETFVRTLLGGANPVGRRVRIEATPSMPETAYEIVGMVKNSVYMQLGEDPYQTMFIALAQVPRPGTGQRVVIHADTALPGVSSAILASMRELDPKITVAFSVLERQIEDSMMRERLMALLSSVFATVAAVLAMLGLYGVVAFTVARRTSEIGLRMALGATRGGVLTMVLREAGVLVIIGVGVGVLLTLAVGRLAQTLLFGIAPTDALTLAAASGVLALLALGASYVPARAATRIEPTVALRAD
jgi:putative ABC transport system permease protein